MCVIGVRQCCKAVCYAMLSVQLLRADLISQVRPHKQPLPTEILVPQALTPHSLESTPQKLEFIISYKAQTHDGIITGERYSIADPITLKAHKLKVAYTCSLNTPINDFITDDESYAIKYILTHYQEEVLECLRKGRARVRYDGIISHNTRVQDSTTFAFSPQRILAYLDNRYVVIDVLKE